jgi:hypothetical protein
MGFSDRGYYRSEPSSFMAEWTGVLTIIVANVGIWVANLLGAEQFSINQFWHCRAICQTTSSAFGNW